jgi:hypothetical protein
VRVVDGALLLKADLVWAGAINTVLVTKGVRVNDLRKELTAAPLMALKPRSAHMIDDEERRERKW